MYSVYVYGGAKQYRVSTAVPKPFFIQGSLKNKNYNRTPNG